MVMMNLSNDKFMNVFQSRVPVGGTPTREGKTKKAACKY
jgi:hypothetical protein